MIVIRFKVRNPMYIACMGLCMMALGMMNKSAVIHGYVLEKASPTFPRPMKLTLGGSFPALKACATDSNRAK